MSIQDYVLPKLIWAEGKWITKNGDAGDAMSGNAGFAAAFPNDRRVRDYVDASFIGDRPYRSPLHARDPNVDLENSFSRDHCLSLCWYTMFTHDSYPLQKIARYASSHWLKVGKEGTYSQHGLTPNVMWAFNSLAPRMPWYYNIWPSWSIAIIQLLSAKTVPAGYRLQLCAEMALLAKLTGQWNWIWKKVIDICVEKQPNNIYYLYIQGETHRDVLKAKLEEYAKTYKPSSDWCWNWMHFEGDRLLACGQDLLLMDVLLRNH